VLIYERYTSITNTYNNFALVVNKIRGPNQTPLNFDGLFINGKDVLSTNPTQSTLTGFLKYANNNGWILTSEIDSGGVSNGNNGIDGTNGTNGIDGNNGIMVQMEILE